MKTFLSIWGQGRTGVTTQAKVETVSLAFFNAATGFAEQEVAAFDNLQIGESCMDYHNGPQTVVRIS